MTRFLIILILVWQPLSLGSLGASPLTDAAHAEMGCCEIVKVVEVDACCKQEARSECGRTGGACHCEAQRGQPLAPAPAIPTTTSSERCLVTAPSERVIVAESPCDALGSPSGVLERFVRSNNTFQAFVGIWRT